MRERLGSEGRMVNLHSSEDDFGIDTTDRIGSFYQVKFHPPPQNPRRTQRSHSFVEKTVLVTKGQLERQSFKCVISRVFR